MKPKVHPNALKHLSYDEVISAWYSTTKSIQRTKKEEPPRWLCIGWLPKGQSVELVAVETTEGWLIIHALSPVQSKFAQEIKKTERRQL